MLARRGTVPGNTYHELCKIHGKLTSGKVISRKIQRPECSGLSWGQATAHTEMKRMLSCSHAAARASSFPPELTSTALILRLFVPPVLI